MSIRKKKSLYRHTVKSKHHGLCNTSLVKTHLEDRSLELYYKLSVLSSFDISFDICKPVILFTGSKHTRNVQYFLLFKRKLLA